MSEMTDVAKASLSDFQACKDKPVRLTADGESMALSIVEVTPVSGPERVGGAFSVLFRGPLEPVVEQGVYTISIDDGQGSPLFLVPIGRDDEGMLYEAVFN